MLKEALCLTVLVSLLALSSTFVQASQITNGLFWLYSTQSVNGNWPRVETNEYYSTAVALDAAYAFEPTNPVYAAGLQWMNVQMESPTDYLSRRIIALRRAGMDFSSEVEGLLLYRDAAGSWVATEGFDGNVLDIMNSKFMPTPA